MKIKIEAEVDEQKHIIVKYPNKGEYVEALKEMIMELEESISRNLPDGIGTKIKYLLDEDTPKKAEKIRT